MWRKLPDFRAEKKVSNPVTSVAVMVFSVPYLLDLIFWKYFERGEGGYSHKVWWLAAANLSRSRQNSSKSSKLQPNSTKPINIRLNPSKSSCTPLGCTPHKTLGCTLPRPTEYLPYFVYRMGLVWKFLPHLGGTHGEANRDRPIQNYRIDAFWKNLQPKSHRTGPFSNDSRHQNDYMQLFLFSGINVLKITKITITCFDP